MDTHNTRGQDVKTKPTPENDWQRLWLATRQQAWTSLAIIPSDGSVDVGQVAETLIATGRLHGEKPVNLLDAKGVQLAGMRQLLDTLSTMTARGDWVIVPVDPISENPSSVPIVQANLRSVCGTIGDVDLLIGGLAENHTAGSDFGHSMQTIVANQVDILRSGERYFW